MSVEEARELKANVVGLSKVFPTRRDAFIPYYRVVFAYAAAWLLTLTCWQRRKFRLLKLHLPP